MELRLHEVYTRYQESYKEVDKGQEPDLNTIINRLCEQNALAPEGREQAHQVRLVANKTLHNGPHEHPTAEKALEVFDAARLVILRMAGG